MGLKEEIILYIDDITVNSDPSVGSAPEIILENYDHIPLILMIGGAEDLSNMNLVPNPDGKGVNLSTYVIKYQRDMDGEFPGVVSGQHYPLR